jgi:hypothetical protein
MLSVIPLHSVKSSHVLDRESPILKKELKLAEFYSLVCDNVVVLLC